MALSAAIADPRRAARASALVAGLGVINVPVIYFSVRWWSTLHQGASISMSAAPRMASQMLLALALTTLACWAYAFAASFARARRLVRDAERDAAWLS
jgi:heme exporter protein C